MNAWVVALLVGLGAALGMTIIGLILAHLVEIRLQSFRELFRDALTQRESFDTVAKALGGRIDTANGHIEAHHRRISEVEAGVDDLRIRVEKVEGKRVIR